MPRYFDFKHAESARIHFARSIIHCCILHFHFGKRDPANTQGTSNILECNFCTCDDRVWHVNCALACGWRGEYHQRWQVEKRAALTKLAFKVRAMFLLFCIRKVCAKRTSPLADRTSNVTDFLSAVRHPLYNRSLSSSLLILRRPPCSSNMAACTPECEQLGVEFAFHREGVPEWVSLTENGKKVWTTSDPPSDDEVLLVCDTKLSEGVHVWKAQALARSQRSGFWMCAGVTTQNKHMLSADARKELTAGWSRCFKGSDRYSCGCVLDGAGPDWFSNDILLLELDCSAGTLNLTNTTTGESDTIREIRITEPVYPCFAFYTIGRGVQLLPV